MDIVIIGTGNTATVLSNKLKDAGHTIRMIWGRNISKASSLSRLLDTKSTDQFDDIPKDADIYIVAVSDGAIEEVANNFKFGEKIIVHTAASVSKDVLKQCSKNYGVFYPLQTLKKETEDVPVIPILIDGNNNDTLDFLKNLGDSISNVVAKKNDEERLKLHLAAVFCNNFTNHLFALIEDYCNKEKLDFNLLKPLIHETSNQLNFLSAASAQTGPAKRNDNTTIEKHIKILEQYPHLKELYTRLSNSIQTFNS